MRLLLRHLTARARAFLRGSTWCKVSECDTASLQGVSREAISAPAGPVSVLRRMCGIAQNKHQLEESGLIATGGADGEDEDADADGYEDDEHG